MLNHFCLREPSAVRSATPTSISATVLYCMLLSFFETNQTEKLRIILLYTPTDSHSLYFVWTYYMYGTMATKLVAKV